MIVSFYIEYGYKIHESKKTWVFWHNDRRCRFDSFKFEIDLETGKLHFIEGRFNEFIGWRYLYKILELLKIDWLYKAIKRPDLVVKQDVFSEILMHKITNPRGLSAYLIDKYELNGIVTPNLFYKEVLASNILVDAGDLHVYVGLLKVADNPQKTLTHLLKLKHRLNENSNFQTLIEMAIEGNEKINLFWSDTRINDELEYVEHIWGGISFDHIGSIYSSNYFYKYKSKGNKKEKAIELHYTGRIQLPKHCELITNSRDLFKEGKKMSHCIASYWNNVLNRRSFVIHMETPQRATFEICKNESGWFIINEMSSYNNENVDYVAEQIMKKYVAKMHNQLFFFKNSCFADNKKHYFLSEPTLYDEVFNPDLFKFKLMNTLIT